ncbi:hypothetical protein KW485_16010 [Enterobacter kobei]|uniref:DUF6311 domain-containing protein n=1 Tax=Enterobacter kobei TaxID=208224 RepID=UPI002174E054|nr:DUF6311 domain-containing protein [Enterobacter kobei]MCS4608066.1 hypothetical protein [Enterobacter kobei]
MADKEYKIAAVIIGVFIFALCGGMQTLDTSNISWMWHGDTTQHWLGWNFFRNTPLLQWPLGLNYPYGMDVSSSIVFTDSIPLIAFLLKPFSKMLPDIFQYTGIWLMLCLVFQALGSYILVRNRTQSKIYALLCVPLFCLSPVMFFRMSGHFALSAHFLIIASIILYYNKNNFGKWLALICISALIHFYLTAMILSIYMAFLIKVISEDRERIKQCALWASATFVSLFIVMYSAGYFVIADGADGFGYGLYKLNLLSFFNPMYHDFSSIISPSVLMPGDYEGFAYLGLGVAVLIIFSFISFCLKRGTTYTSLPLIFVCFLLFLFAVSNNIFAGDRNLLLLPLPEFALKIANIFRSSGRFIWPVIYIAILLSLVYLKTIINRRSAYIIVITCVAVQIYDIRGAFNFLDKRYSERGDISQGVDVKSLSELLKFKSAIEVIKPIDFYNDWSKIGYVSSINKVSMNFGYMARFSKSAKIQQEKSIYNTMYNGIYNPSHLYLFKNKETLNIALKNIKQKSFVKYISGYYALSVSNEQIDNNNALSKDEYYKLLYSLR